MLDKLGVRGVVGASIQVLPMAEDVTQKERAVMKRMEGGIAIPALARELFGRGG